MDDDLDVPGPVSVVDRIGALTRAVADHEPKGATTSELGREAQIARPSVHRLLASLERQGFVERDPTTGRWVLGAELFLLGTSAAARYDVRPVAQPVVRRLADLTEESAFYSVVRGHETVCLIREDGAFPIRSHVLHEGARFPLGVVSAGIAVLAFLPERDAEAYLASTDLVPDFGPAHAPDRLRERLTETRRLGWSLNPGLIVEGSWGMGAAVFDATGRPVGALSLTGVQTRFGARRRRELGSLLLKAAHTLGSELGRRPARQL